MQKLILASCGFRAPEAVQKCIEFVGKPAEKISFGVINEAYVPYHFSHDWVIDDLISIHDNFTNDTNRVLGLLPIEIIPHLHGKFSLSTTEEQIIPESTKQPYTIYGISDNAAVIVEGDNIYPVGHDFIVAKDGKLI